MSGPQCLTILPTYQCTAACHNCCFGSHPWVKGRISQEEILSYITQAATFDSLSLVCFSGGECFLLGDDLVRAIAVAHDFGLATRCVTNGSWATDERTARNRLKKLADAGLTEINFSTGDNHAMFVPVERVIFGAGVARRLGITVAIMVELTGERSVTKETLLEHPLYAQFLAGDPAEPLLINESPWMSMDEGCDSVKYAQSQLVNRDNVGSKSGCDSILSTIVVNPQQELYACCGIASQQIPEVRLGSLQEASMSDMYSEAVSDFLKVWVAVDGPEKIVAWASEFDPSIDWEDRFSHQCDACKFMYQDTRVRQVIREHFTEKLPDVLLRHSISLA